MTDHLPSPAAETPRRRADAERSIARIIEAAIECLSRDPEASIAEIARQAGVVRATVYVHFPTRESLIAAMTQQAIHDVAGVIAATEPEHGDPVEALRRVIAATWQSLGRYHALVAVNARLPHDDLHHQHGSALGALEPLIARGQKAGAFRREVPVSWHLSTVLALTHNASGELSAGRIPEDQVADALSASVVGALTAGASA